MMHQAGLALFIVVQALAITLLLAGIPAFRTVLRGSFLLRRIARAGRQDFGPIILKSPMVPAVSTIATPRDASADSLQFTRRLLDLHFGRNEVVIVLDGPSAEELDIWTRELHLRPSTRGIEHKLPSAPVRGVYESSDPIRVVVIDKEAGGPVDAWNAGVNASTSPVIGILDPESDFVPDVLLRLIQPMADAAEETVGVVGGVPAPPGEGIVGRIGALESLRWWLTLGAAFAARRMVMPFPGAALLIKRSAVIQAGGFAIGPLELFLRIHALGLVAGKPYRISFLPEPVSQSRAPRDLAGLRARNQREHEMIRHAVRNRLVLAGPFGWPALRGLFYAYSVRPVLETVALVLGLAGLVTGSVDIYTFLLVLVSTVGVGTVLSMATVVLREVAEPHSPDERRMLALFLAAIPENLLYRQRRNLWLLEGLGKPVGHEKQNRESTVEDRPPAASTTSA